MVSNDTFNKEPAIFLNKLFGKSLIIVHMVTLNHTKRNHGIGNIT